MSATAEELKRKVALGHVLSTEEVAMLKDVMSNVENDLSALQARLEGGHMLSDDELTKLKNA